MNARFAEACREKHLELEGFENRIFLDNVNDGRTLNHIALTCEEDIFIGVFFDGTNNNKYRDTPGFTHSNVARLYEVYPGMTARQTPPTFRPRVNPDGSTSPRPIFPDEPFRPASVPANKLQYHRKIYVPGVGTPMPDVGDTGAGLHKTLGLAFAGLSQLRIDWALLQLCNQVHAAVFGAPLQDSVRVDTLMRSYRKHHDPLNPPLPEDDPVARAVLLMGPQRATVEGLRELDDWMQRQLGHYDAGLFQDTLKAYVARLGAILTQRGRTKPTLRKIRLSVFGFSRGAGEARAWVNLLQKHIGHTLCGIPLQVDFLGLFDTVASVGMAQSVPYANGHFTWAAGDNLCVPGSVRRCVHLVAAHEVRGSFPLDSVCQGEMLPFNCKEIVYPGVHSDVGGGYPPGDQGRAQDDSRKLSQITLAQMYREARMAGVPLAPASAMDAPKARNFAIHPQLRDDFNAYVEATRTDRLPPDDGPVAPWAPGGAAVLPVRQDPSGTAANTGTGAGTGKKSRQAAPPMFPTETQPREPLIWLIRRHGGYLLQWRKALLNQAGGAAGLPQVLGSTVVTRFQDREDIRGAEEELRKELAFLRSDDPEKFKQVDDPLLSKIPTNEQAAVQAIIDLVKGLRKRALGKNPTFAVARALAYYLTVWLANGSIESVMREKQNQWDQWVEKAWNETLTPQAVTDVHPLFEDYVHDSRAWFKMLFRTDVAQLAADDEDWFVFGGREAERRERIAELEKKAADLKADGARPTDPALQQCAQALAQLRQEGAPLMMGGREPYRMCGYLRHRRVYQSGVRFESARWSAADARKEHARQLAASRDRRLAAEQARHAAEVQRINDESQRITRENRLSSAEQAEAQATLRARMAREKADHADRMQTIQEETATPATPATT